MQETLLLELRRIWAIYALTAGSGTRGQGERDSFVVLAPGAAGCIGSFGQACLCSRHPLLMEHAASYTLNPKAYA